MSDGATPLVSLVVAAARNGTIGRDGDMPWRLASDLARFKRMTLAKPIVMGRRTFDSIGRALPGRHTIVVTRDAAWSAPGAERVASPQEALSRGRKWAHANGATEVCVCGGGEIYRALRADADAIRLTRIEAEIAGDTVFDIPDPAAWRAVSSIHTPAGARNSHATTYNLHLRR